jgi:hypothetical protein
MPSRRRSLVSILGVIAILLAPPSIWAFFKPVRALAPEWAGVTCYPGGVCTDDPARASEALSLKVEAMSFVNAWAGPFEAEPRMIFCTTAACDRNFGFRGNAAYNVGATALVVATRGWKPYYIRHELIHCVQVERIGGFRMLLHTPAWLIEGMAYSASQDPRRPLQEPWETYRRQFEEWAQQVPAEALWSQAAAQ